MALRLLQAKIPDTTREFLDAVFREEQQIIDRWEEPLEGGGFLVRLLLPQNHTESVSDLLRKHFGNQTGFRAVFLPVEATLPYYEESEEHKKKAIGRISREELYSDIASGTEISRLFILTVILSAIVAAIGLRRGDTAIVIGAMVIAPLLTPNIGLALSFVLGSRNLAKTALSANALGLGLTLILAASIGFFLGVDKDIPAIAARTEVGLGDILLSLASGCAGTLAFTAGAPAALTGVMVAVALMPPLVVCGMFLGTGAWELAGAAFLLCFVNISGVNLSAILTLIAQGVSPMHSWRKDSAKTAGQIGLLVWMIIIICLVGLILWRS
ncbi:putative hydrophobic protein (TIGR00341 family) [Desulfobotulus alkaliphilus]|uniref:Putative hydrophobic protein (TIGR00341 family) n=1 Tax=Desulfobotulus alkaliphilus TaxID=622671 RepID=A0A562S366_9BACT|nr:TIGR00341 family protein [Desulfobotulus alkaliphilus]TWI75648.1 putative hydrophobic protein (TIGR00341 family) [Desulfobotulus alkaliphilus]